MDEQPARFDIGFAHLPINFHAYLHKFTSKISSGLVWYDKQYFVNARASFLSRKKATRVRRNIELRLTRVRIAAITNCVGSKNKYAKCEDSHCRVRSHGQRSPHQ